MQGIYPEWWGDGSHQEKPERVKLIKKCNLHVDPVLMSGCVECM